MSTLTPLPVRTFTRFLRRAVLVMGLALVVGPSAALAYTFNSATDVPVTASSYSASGTISLSLNYAPVTGTNLTVINNTGLDFISGKFSNLAQGQGVVLNYVGVSYSFVANYYGGTGNDLVLQWAKVRELAWGYNSNGQLGDNSTTDSQVPTAVLSNGVLLGKTVTAVAAGGGHSLALCSDGTVAAWGSNTYGQLGNSSTTERHTAVAVVSSGVLSGKTVVAVAAAGSHSLALCSDGTVAAWGYNGSGQLGNNNTTNSNVPVAVNVASGTSALYGKTVVALAAGANHSLALCSDGTVAAWGYNAYGALGNNSTTDSQVPVAVNVTSGTSVLDGKTVVSVAAGGYHSLALCSDGTVAGWGWNSYGQLGNNSTTQSKVPLAVNVASGTSALYGKTVVALAAGDYHSLTLCSDGTVAAWGRDESGQLGNNSTTQRNVPVAVNVASGTSALYGKTVVALSAGVYHSVALCSDGTVAAWGQGGSGTLGNNSTGQSNVPVAVNTSTLANGERFSLVASGRSGSHTLALVAAPPPPPPTVTLGTANLAANATTLTISGTNFDSTTPGNNTVVFSPSGTGTVTASTATSLTVTGISGLTVGGLIAVVTTPSGNSFAAVQVATVIPYGLTYTFDTATSVGATSFSYTPVGPAVFSLNFAPVNGTNLTVINNTGLYFSSGRFSNLAQGQSVVLSYGGVSYSFVANYYGGTGNDLVLQWAKVRELAWGYNGQGQLGNNSTTDSQVPAAVLSSGALSGKTVVAVAAGRLHSVALCSDGTVAAWGDNTYGQLGNNSTTQSKVPVAVNVASGTSALYGKTVVAVSVGSDHTLTLCSDGTVAAWGINLNGQLGNNSTTQSKVPVAVNVVSGTSALYGKTVVSLAAGSAHSVALCSDGTLASWGYNLYGQLGNNSTTDRYVPVAVDTSGALYSGTAVAVSAGGNHSLALRSDGTVVAWGWNTAGQLGNNSTTDSPVPVAVNVTSGTSALYGKTVAAVAAGLAHSMALCSDGTVATWGSNGYGQLGDNSTTQGNVPVAVNVASGTSVLYGKTVVSLAAGSAHSMALCSDGTVAAWGRNTNGQLGNNSTTDSPVPAAVNTSALGSGERFSLVVSGRFASHTLALVAAPPAPEIAIEQPAGTGLTDGSSTLSFGVMAAGSSTAAKIFTVKSLGGIGLTGIVINQDGTHAGDYTVNTIGMTTTVAPNASTTFTVTFTPAAAAVSGTRTAALHIASNDPNQNPFDIALSGTGLSQTYDTDADGLNDAAEFKLSTLGFDWQTAQPALVATLTTNANTANLFTQTQVTASRQSGRDDVTGSPNTYSLYTQSQFQALSVGVPLLQMNGATGQFKLTIGVQKATDLVHFTPFPLTAPQTTVNAQGQLELQFTVPDNAAFFRLKAQ